MQDGAHTRRDALTSLTWMTSLPLIPRRSAKALKGGVFYLGETGQL
jgi:hypothetical protein